MRFTLLIMQRCLCTYANCDDSVYPRGNASKFQSIMLGRQVRLHLVHRCEHRGVVCTLMSSSTCSLHREGERCMSGQSTRVAPHAALALDTHYDDSASQIEWCCGKFETVQKFACDPAVHGNTGLAIQTWANQTVLTLRSCTQQLRGCPRNAIDFRNVSVVYDGLA